MKLAALFSLALLIGGAQATTPLDWKACAKEVKEFKCTGDDKSIWACLEKHDDKLTASCQKVHEKGDKIFKF